MSRVRVYNYTFIPGAANAGKVVIPGRIDISNVLLITNITRNDVIYSFSDPDRGAFSVDYTWPTTGVNATTVAGQQTTDGYTTITLKYNTSTYAATDKLTIFVEELSSATRFLPQETYVDPANKLRISQPQSLIDTDFELGLQPSKWEFVQGHNNQPSFFVRPSDSPLSPITGGMGFTVLNQTISVSGNIATVTLSGGNVLPVAPGEGSYVYIVEASNGANFNTVRYSVLPGATTTSVQFYSSAGNGSYTAAALVISGVQPTQANFGAGSHAIIQVSNDISASGTPIAANTPIQVLESLNETFADGTFFVINSNTSSRAFFFRVKSLFAFQSDLIKLGSTVVYGGNLFGSNVVSSNLKIFSVTSLGTETNGRTVIVNSRQPHGLYAGAPIFISNLVANGANAQGSYYVASVPSETQFVYYVPSQITAAAGTTSTTNANAVVGSNILRFASAPTAPIGASVTGTNIPQGTFVVGKFDSDRAIRLNQPVTTQVNSGTTITFSQVLSQSTTQVFVRPEGNQFHRSIDGGVQITSGTNIPYDYALRQTRRYFRYQSGKGIQFSTAALFKPIYDITSISVSGTTATITTDQDHGLQPGATVTLSNIIANSVADSNLYNSTFLVQPTPVITAKTFTVTLSGTPTDTNPGGDGQVTVAQSVGSTTRLGLFDDGNGFFWEFDGQNFNAVRRNSTTVLRGQINILTGASLITGSNTRFTRQLSVNDKIFIRGQVYTIKAILSDSALMISPFYRAATPSTNLGNNGVPFSTVHTYTNGSGSPAAAASQTAWINSNAFTTTSTFAITTSPTGNASGAYQLTFGASVAAVAPGMVITGTGVPTGTYVSSVITATNTVTISNALTAAATNTSMTFGAVPSGVASNVIAVANSTGIAPGMLITGTGVPANTTVVSVPNSTSVYVTPAITTGVSNAVSLTFNAVSSTESILARIGATTIAAGSTSITLDAASSGITYAAPGMHIAGCPAFPSGTFITSYNSTTRVATLSAGASEAFGPAAQVNITNTTVTTNICTTSANHGLVPGQMIYLTGTAFGGLTTNRYYYVNTTPAANTFTIATSPGGTNIVLSTASGTMAVSIACTFGYRASIFNTTNTTVNDFHPIAHQARDIRLNCTNTTTTTNLITTSTTANLYEGMPVIFTGTTFGNIVAGTTYYIRQIVSATTFTVSNAATGASDFALLTASGNMVMLISCIGVNLPNYIQTGGTFQQATTRVYQEDVAVKITKVVETRVPSQNFNIDRLDGTGPSNYTINTARIQMVYIDYTWYGAGFIRWGLRANNGDIMYAHKMQHNNNEVQAYLRSGNLPGRFEVSNTPTFGRLTTAIATSGYTTASPGTIQVDNASGFYVPSGLIANGDVNIDGEYFAYTGIAANANTSSPWFLGSGSPSVATATCAVSGGRISTVTLGSAGSGYTAEPPILVSGGGGFGAQFKAILNNGSISSIQIINQGFGYTSAPTLIIGPNQLTGAVRENSYVTATNGVTTASTTVGSNLITVPSNANWKLGQIIAPPITQFNFITPLKVVGFNGTTQVYVDQPATVAASGTATLPLALRGTVETAHNIASTTTAASIVWQSRNDCTPAMQHYGVSSIMDGRFDTDRSIVFTTPRSTAAVVNPAGTSPLVSIRVAPSVDNGFARNFGIRNVVNRMQLVLSSLGVYNQGAFLITVRLNATSTVFTPANWAANSVGSGSLAQVIYHNPGDALVGGDVVVAFYASAAGGTNFTATAFDLDKVKDLGHSVVAGDGVYPDGPDVLTITATNLSSTVPGVIFSRLSWTEAQA